MIRTKNIIKDIREVPSAWTFEYYLKLQEKLMGQEVFMVGPFNPAEKVPSFTLFSSKEGMYTFKCFSSGKGGSHIEFVKEMFKLASKSEAIIKIIKDYKVFLDSGGLRDETEYQTFDKFKVTAFELRKWNTFDQRFYGRFFIGSKILEWLNVSPLASFKMSKMENGELKEIEIVRDNLYGYFTKSGQLYRIYQPYNKDCKFIKVLSWIMGLDQLKYETDNLLITKSLKDVAAFYELNIPNWEAVSAESENAILPKEFIDLMKTKYKRIVTLMDDDKAGYEAMDQYKNLHDLDGIKLNMKKDTSDSMEEYGPEMVRERMLERLDPNYDENLPNPF